MYKILVLHLRLLQTTAPDAVRDGGEHVEQQCQSARVEPDEPRRAEDGHEHVAAHGAAARTVVLAEQAVREVRALAAGPFSELKIVQIIITIVSEVLGYLHGAVVRVSGFVLAALATHDSDEHFLERRLDDGELRNLQRLSCTFVKGLERIGK